MARKSRKNMPVAVAEPTDNLTAKAVLSMDKEAKPYQVGIYARLSFESEANKERDTVDTQIAYIREFINSQDDMVEVEVYADISVTGTTFERPEFDRMILLLPVTLADLGEIMWKQATTLRGYFLFLM